MSIEAWVSSYTGSTVDRLRQLLIASTTGATTAMATNDLWLMFLAQRGYTSGSLNDRIRNYLLSYTGASSGSTDDLWALITSPFSEYTGILDTYPGAKLAYSTGRRLRGLYFGPLFRVRRSSDNAEQDIGFDEDGVVDIAALTAFVGAGNGYVTTEYNQAEGGGFDASIGTTSLQPAIVLAGVVQTLGTNAIPAPLWDGTAGVIGDDRLSAANVTFGTLPQMSVWWAARKDANTLYRAICHIGTANIGTGEMALYSPDVDQGGDTVTAYNNTTTPSNAVTGAVPFTYVGRFRGNLQSGSTLRAIRVNKGAEGSGTTTSNSSGYGTKNFHIGNRSDNLAGFMGLIGEVLVYQSLTPATTDGIDDDIMNFWGI